MQVKYFKDYVLRKGEYVFLRLIKIITYVQMKKLKK
jgi:hypothetical protein